MLLNQFKADPTIRDNSGQKASSFLQKCTSNCKVDTTLIFCVSRQKTISPTLKSVIFGCP